MQIEKIIHIADIHIRPFKRHKEYEDVFKKIYKYIDSVKDENTVIFLGGDIVHNKIELSPELITVTQKFLKNCADRCPTILILGNHDFSPNSQRLDALSPIVDSMNHPNLHFWKNSNVYKLGNINFSVFSLLGDDSEWVTANDIKGKNTKIALFHGPVIGKNNTSIHIEANSRTLKIDRFAGFDMVLLGDLHNQHFVDNELHIGYPGSTICQGFGEQPTGHGLLVWDVKNRKSEFVEIDNDYCYYTLRIVDNSYKIPKGLPKKVRLRVIYENSNTETVGSAIEEFSKKYSIVELTKQKLATINTTQHHSREFGNSRDVQYQNKCIAEHLKGQNVDNETIEKILQLNTHYNKSLTSNPHRNIFWNPKKLEFSNMFSYGENNEIDFTDFKGVYGIVAPNHYGKSVLLEILCFALYDKSTRATKAIHILNNNKTTFSCKFCFEFNGTDYYIERVGVKNEKTNAVRVDVRFWTTDEEGNEINLSGEDRDQTNKTIREYVGQYDDFVMTALSTQYDNQSFVDKTQRERKDLLYKFLDISIYDELYKIVKETEKEQKVLLRDYEKQNLFEKHSELSVTIEESNVKVAEYTDQSTQIKTEIRELNSQLMEQSKQLQAVEDTIDIGLVESQIANCERNINETIVQLKDIENEKKTLNDEKVNLEKGLDNIDIERVKVEKEKYVKDLTDIQTQLNKSKITLTKVQSEIKSITEKIDKLQNHEYDPNCQYCCNNDFVKDAIESKEKLPLLTNREDSFNHLILLLEQQFEETKNYVNAKNQFIQKFDELSKIKSKLETIDEKVKSLKYKGKSLQQELKTLKVKQEKYKTNKNTIQLNQQIEKTINDLKTTIRQKESDENKIDKLLKQSISNQALLKSEFNTIKENITRYTELLKENRVYDLYTQSLSKDGVPYRIIEQILPLIESEVNEILNQIVDFTVRIESSEEKYIHAYIDYGNGQQWPVEITSGMERFIISLAFRSALSEITSLPRPQFLAIDEGFGVLDTDNILSMGKLFEFLKSRYNYLLIISHIDLMKDLCEKRINVTKVNGFSAIELEV